jgi:dolichol-phosphate mannosyltransferase
VSVAVVMPAFNEAEGISEFVLEIIDAFETSDVTVIVIDDASADRTTTVIEQLTAQGVPVTVRKNERNLGHGPSTLRALRAGLGTAADIVVAVDGDGQFLGKDVAQIAMLARTNSWDIVEGVRTGREDPFYRRMVSRVTRTLVRRACGSAPRDANTPLRAYPRHRLQALVDALPEDAMTPNLLISASVRRNNWGVAEVDVASLRRRGASSVGSTWGASRIKFPSRRFIVFCWDAFNQWRQFQSEGIGRQ